MELERIYEHLEVEYPTPLASSFGEGYVAKYLVRLVDDPHFPALRQAVEARDLEVICREAHTLKGMCANLSLDPIQNACSDLVQYLRDGGEEDANVDALFAIIECYFVDLFAAINELQGR